MQRLSKPAMPIAISMLALYGFTVSLISLADVNDRPQMVSDVGNLREAPTVNSSNISTNVMDREILINDAMIVAADVTSSNGVIHAIDTVILSN